MVAITPERAAFLAERGTGIGGSDIASVFGIGYGCRLRLWREKRGETPDFPREETGPMALGNLLEPYFRGWYEQITGRMVEMAGVARHPGHPELLVHSDGVITDPQRGDDNPGVLEIKSMGRGAYYNVKRQGLPEDYILQLQHAMLVTGATWGSFAIGSRDLGVTRPSDLLWWDVERDAEVCKEILAEGPTFWAQVENGPMPEALEPDDRRCQDCAYRTSCQGAALQAVEKAGGYTVDESLAALVREHEERRLLEKEAKELLADTKAELKAKLGDRTLVMAGGARLQHYTISKAEYVVKAHDERPLRVYAPKERR